MNQKPFIEDALQQEYLKERVSFLEKERRDLVQRIVTLEHEILEYTAIKNSITYKFLLFHRTITHILLHPLDIYLAFALLKREGWREFVRRVKYYSLGKRLPNQIDYFGDYLPLSEQYKIYMHQHQLTPMELKNQKEASKKFSYCPIISILVPVYNVAPKWLDLCLESVMNQTYPYWELCLHDDASPKKETVECLKKWEKKDPRIKVSYGQKNQHISGATNSAFLLATGDYIALLDNDDEIAIDALYSYVETINNLGSEILYCDEDKMTEEGERTDPHFKPEFSPDLLLSHNYITHFFVFKKSLLKKGELPFTLGTEGAQDHDLIIRMTERSSKIKRIPKILYHWRMLDTSTSKNPLVKPEALISEQKVLESALERRNIKGKVLDTNALFSKRIQRELSAHPLVSIVIPFKDNAKLLKGCIVSILSKSTYKNFEIFPIS